MDVEPGQGLSGSEVERRREEYGENELPRKKGVSALKIALRQFTSPLVYALLAAGGISLFLQKWADALVILGALFINGVFGFFEEYKASRVLASLEKVVTVKAIALRGGHKKELRQEELVPGDILFLKAGDKVPADVRLLRTENLKISQALLTGEWKPVSKSPEKIALKTPVPERKNTAYMGTVCEKGRGQAVVTATGEETEMGKIARLVRETEEGKTPLQKKIKRFTTWAGAAIGIIGTLILVAGGLTGHGWLRMFEAAVAISVGGIPEALPIVVTLSLTLGMQRILKKKGLIRNLASVETLGSTNVLCVDKTKTLTRGEMRLDRVWGPDREKALKTAALVNTAFVENPEAQIENWKVRGSPTERGLVLGAGRRGFARERLMKTVNIRDRLEFTSARKLGGLALEEAEEQYFLVLGAPEKIASLAARVPDSYGEKLEELSRKGLRVLAAAWKKGGGKLRVENLKGLEVAGLLALEDPLRKDVEEAIETCRKAGVSFVMITGDYEATARAVASKLGLSLGPESLIEGEELDRLGEEEFEKRIGEVSVFARAEPRHKIKIVEAWQKKGKVVGMTGDGVNDAPALKKADIGVAVGSGTEVAKEASDLVLLNNSFSVLVETVRQGRIIFQNIRKSVSYILADAFTAVLLVSSALVGGLPLPVYPLQLFWNNIVEDTLPDLALAFEKGKKDIMERDPLSSKAPLFTEEMKVLVFGTGLIDEFFSFLLFLFLLKDLGPSFLPYIRTMVFGSICMDTAFVVFAYKSLKKNLWEINPFDNLVLLASSTLVFLALGAALYIPFLGNLLHTVPLNLSDWVVLVGMSLFNLFLVEITKWFFISRHR